MMSSLKHRLVEGYYRYKCAKARRAFEAAIPYRDFLPDELFEEFVEKYGSIPAAPMQDYSEEGMKSLATQRVEDIRKKIGFEPQSVLEIGPGTGSVAKLFKEQGVPRVTAVDIVDILSPAARQAGVELVLADAADMSVLADKSYDLIVSWGALEHIPRPQPVFDGCLRLLKPGGYLYLAFGPLYYSPWGGHHYSVLRCPYLHLLFPDRLIREYAKKVKGEGYEGYLTPTNGLPLAAYNFVKAPLPPSYVLESFESGFDHYSSDVVTRYPEIFKYKGVPFEDLFVDAMRLGIFRNKE